MEITKPITLDLLDIKSPALSTSSDMPVIETQPDATKPAEEKKSEAKAVPAAPAKDETKEVKSDASTTNSESATEHTDESPGEPEEVKKPPRGVQKRLDELARREADALRQVETERQEKLRLLALLEKGTEKPKAETVTEDAEPTRPTRSAFDTTEAYDAAVDTYIDARAEWKINEGLKVRSAQQEKEAQQKAIEEGAKATREAYVGRVEKAKEKYSDYEAVAESPDVKVSIPMAHAIMSSEHGPDIAYHLGKNPAEAERISKLPPPSQLVELGLIVAQLKAAPAKAEVPAVEVKAKPPVSNAPKPIKPLGAGSDVTPKSPEEESMEEYGARRKKELAAAGRPGTRH